MLSFDLFLPFCLTLHYFLFYSQALLISPLSLSFFLSLQIHNFLSGKESCIQKVRPVFIPKKGPSPSLLECMCMGMYVLALQSYLTLYDLMDYSPPVSSIHRILQARILEWVAIPSSRGSPDPGIEARSPALQMASLPSEPPGKPSFVVKEPKFFIKKNKNKTKNCSPFPVLC